jgi:hypothetical protein
VLAAADVYADIVATVALLAAIASFFWQRYTWNRAPEHAVAVQEAQDRHEMRKNAAPILRSDVTLVRQFTKPDSGGWFEPPALVTKTRVRLGKLRDDWTNLGDSFADRVHERMTALEMDEEIAWLQGIADPDASKYEIHNRLVDLDGKLERVLDALS